ncbi:hypothetical protein KP509_08G069400 [Ceratopteris richardii]|uniref:Uncharacterized protein n=1 Tax=Ceratopteris richardii TaxID=49495 RepID=A0A8T2U6L9_CERRI|nr:hypothetical protein KP509_08G069400 [Ceratopteris richardii]
MPFPTTTICILLYCLSLPSQNLVCIPIARGMPFPTKIICILLYAYLCLRPPFIHRTRVL